MIINFWEKHPRLVILKKDVDFQTAQCTSKNPNFKHLKTSLKIVTTQGVWLSAESL